MQCGGGTARADPTARQAGKARMGRIAGLKSNWDYWLRLKGKDKSGWGDYGPPLEFRTRAARRCMAGGGGRRGGREGGESGAL